MTVSIFAIVSYWKKYLFEQCTILDNRLFTHRLGFRQTYSNTKKKYFYVKDA